MLKKPWIYLGVVCGVAACSGDDTADGLAASGGAGGTSNGGIVGSGGTTASGGGSPTSNTGGTAPSSGGDVGAGGGPSSGGAMASSGGAPASSGGATGSSGGASPSSGGAPPVTGGATGSGGSGGSGGDPAPVCKSNPPDQFEPNTRVGGGGAQYKDSAHFRYWGTAPSGTIDGALNQLEAAYGCFVIDWCFRSQGLSVHSDAGPYYKLNVYGRTNLGTAAGVMQYDATAGLSYLEVLDSQMGAPRVTVHEYGHGLAIAEKRWMDQQRTGAWWETMANWVADTYLTSSYCEPARARFGIQPAGTIIDLAKVIGQSHLLIVSTQNYYEAWPFFTYLTTNMDGYPGIGRMAVPDLMRNHPRNNETPLHVLERIAAPVKVQTILGRYWARMAYLDIGHPSAKAAFFARRGSLNFVNLDSLGGGRYRVKAARQPQYGGANIIPLRGTGTVTVQVSSGRAFTATLAIRAADGNVRYVDLPNGAGEGTVSGGEEASLVVVNTPATLIQYDAFATSASSPEAAGLNYEVSFSGGPVPAN